MNLFPFTLDKMSVNSSFLLRVATVQHWDHHQGMLEMMAVPTDGSDDEYLIATSEHVF